MNARISKEAHGTRRNLKNGLRLLVFKHTDLDDFYVSQDQILVLAIIYSVVIFLGGFLLSLPKPEFTFYGIATLATHLTFLALCGYCFSKVIDEKNQVIPLYIVLLLSAGSDFFEIRFQTLQLAAGPGTRIKITYLLETKHQFENMLHGDRLAHFGQTNDARGFGQVISRALCGR